MLDLLEVTGTTVEPLFRSRACNCCRQHHTIRPDRVDMLRNHAEHLRWYIAWKSTAHVQHAILAEMGAAPAHHCIRSLPLFCLHLLLDGFAHLVLHNLVQLSSDGICKTCHAALPGLWVVHIDGESDQRAWACWEDGHPCSIGERTHQRQHVERVWELMVGCPHCPSLTELVPKLGQQAARVPHFVYVQYPEPFRCNM